MNVLHKLDRTSQLLLGISLLGIFASLLGFWLLARQGPMGEGHLPMVAQLEFFQNDTRVKRSNEIHWNTVNRELECYENDRIFTGPDSRAKLRFEGGGEITLLPNSLVFISQNMVELESGTIEVDIGQGGSLGIKSFGEKFTAKENTRLKIIQEGNVKKIIPLNESAKSLTQSEVSEFVAEQLGGKGPPISINVGSKVLDFSANPIYTADIASNPPCDEYIYTLRTGKELVQESTSTDPLYTLKELPDGNYVLRVVGKLKGKIVGEATFSFEVKSRKIEPPQIKKKKIKLFVQVMQTLLDFIIPTAYSQAGIAVALAWEGPENAEYQLEISENEKDKIIDTIKLRRRQYNFIIPRAGIFYWRVRYKQGGLFSPFSEYGDIEAQDKVMQIQKPLMTGPAANAKIPSKSGKVTFKWREPHPEFTYTLEIFDSQKGKPIHSREVKGGKADHRLSKKPGTYWWRIVAKGQHGVTSPIQDKHRFSIVSPSIPKAAINKEVKKDEGVDYIELKSREDVRGGEW